MKKRIIGILFTAVLGLLLGVPLAGCGYKPQGTFYSLQEAYDAGYITRADLEEIARRHNNAPYLLEEELDAQIKRQILEDRAEWLRNLEEDAYPEAEASGVRIVRYYGVYQGNSYALILNSRYELDYPMQPVEQPEFIDCIEFMYYNPLRIIIWKKN